MPTKISILREYCHRLERETPVFFRKLRRFGAMLVAMGGACPAPELLSTPVRLPDMLTTISHYAIMAGVVIVAVASAACSNPPEQQ